MRHFLWVLSSQRDSNVFSFLQVSLIINLWVSESWVVFWGFHFLDKVCYCQQINDRFWFKMILKWSTLFQSYNLYSICIFYFCSDITLFIFYHSPWFFVFAMLSLLPLCPCFLKQVKIMILTAKVVFFKFKSVQFCFEFVNFGSNHVQVFIFRVWYFFIFVILILTWEC